MKSALVSFQFAADAYRLCLLERTKERDDWNWALTNYNLGLVLTDIASGWTGTMDGAIESGLTAARTVTGAGLIGPPPRRPGDR